MSEPIRIKLEGRNAEQWNRVFTTLTDVIAQGVLAVAPHEDEEEKEETRQLVSAFADLTKGFVKAKIDRPGLENERILADVFNLFEEAKLKRSQRQKQEIENESARLDLMVKRVETAIKLLGMLQNSFVLDRPLVPDGHGELTLVLTNQNLAMLCTDLTALSQGEPEEKV